MKAVLRYPEKADRDAASRTGWRYSCFDSVGENTQT
jgi:hypothetical protein